MDARFFFLQILSIKIDNWWIGGSLGITCTTYKNNLGVTKIIVGYGRLEYVETLDPSLGTNKWIVGKYNNVKLFQIRSNQWHLQSARK